MFKLSSFYGTCKNIMDLKLKYFLIKYWTNIEGIYTNIVIVLIYID